MADVQNAPETALPEAIGVFIPGLFPTDLMS
jgi:hypothetical protein